MSNPAGYMTSKDQYTRVNYTKSWLQLLQTTTDADSHVSHYM